MEDYLEFAGARILVVEDNRVNQLVLLGWLRRAGIQTTLAQNGREALNLLAQVTPVTPATPQPDLILMDVQMPELDGLEATRQLRQLGLGLPIIGVSASDNRTAQEACFAAGMNDFLAKPIDADMLWGCLTRWIHPREQGSGLAQESAETRFLSNQAALTKARLAFVESHADDARLLAIQLSTHDYTAMAKVAHGLKGAAAILDLQAVHQTCLAIEKTLRQKDCALLDAQVCRLATELSEAIAALEKTRQLR